MYWRYEMKQALPQNRSVVFWRNDAENIKIADSDIVHYWGAQADIPKSNYFILIKFWATPLPESSSHRQIYCTLTRESEIFGLIPQQVLTASGNKFIMASMCSLKESIKAEY